MVDFRDRENFRSPSSVVLKLNNIKQAADGGGLPHNSRMDREIWEQFCVSACNFDPVGGVIGIQN